VRRRLHLAASPRRRLAGRIPTAFGSGASLPARRSAAARRFLRAGGAGVNY